jgi:hypothetical protein
MNRMKLLRRWAACMGLAALTVSLNASAIEVQGLQGFDQLFGRYAPAGDCRRQPQIVIDVVGMTFEVAGKEEVITNPEYAAAYGPHDYQGISQWFFPFRSNDDFPILMTFNHGEEEGVLVIEGHGEGYPGGPPLSPRNAALVNGSPYARCDP